MLVVLDDDLLQGCGVIAPELISDGLFRWLLGSVMLLEVFVKAVARCLEVWGPGSRVTWPFLPSELCGQTVPIRLQLFHLLEQLGNELALPARVCSIRQFAVDAGGLVFNDGGVFEDLVLHLQRVPNVCFHLGQIIVHSVLSLLSWTVDHPQFCIVLV